MPRHSHCKNHDLFGSLSKAEVQVLLLSWGLIGKSKRDDLRKRTWSQIMEIVEVLPSGFRDELHEAKEHKKREASELQKSRSRIKVQAHRERRHGEAVIPSAMDVDEMDNEERPAQDDEPEERDNSHYMDLPTTEERKACFAAFYKATSNEALALSICVVCGRGMMKVEGE